MGEPHLDALAFAARLLEGLGADPRPSHITSVLINAARDPAKRRLLNTPAANQHLNAHAQLPVQLELRETQPQAHESPAGWLRYVQSFT